MVVVRSQGHGHPLPQGWLSGIADAGHHVVVDPDRLLGAAQLAEDHALVVEGH
jgi:hypothetical protein